MHFPTRRTLGRLTIMGCLSLIGANAALSQASRAPQPVILAIADSFPAHHGRAVIMRYPTASSEDVIILSSSDATPDALGAALQLLRRLRAKGAPSNMQVVTMTGAQRVVVPPKVDRWLQKVIDRTLANQPKKLGNIGRGHWLELADARIGS